MKHWKVSIWSVWRELGAYCSNRIYHFCYKYLILWYSYIFLDKTKDLIQTSELLDKVLTKKKKKKPVHNASVNYSCVPFLGFSYIRRLGISLEVNERVGKSVFSVSKRTPKDWQMHFMPLKKLTKLSGFDLFIFWTQCIYIVHQLKGMQSSKLAIWKVYRLLIEGIWKGYLFCSLWKQPFLLAPRHWDVLRGGTSVTEQQKFHTDNV